MNAAALGIVGSLFVSLATSQAAIAQTVAAKQQAQRGEYLIAYGGCNDCHTPKLVTPSGPVPDNSRLLSGHPANAKLPPVPADVGTGPDKWGAITNADLTAWAGPWGISFAANLTPDLQTGIGGARVIHQDHAYWQAFWKGSPAAAPNALVERRGVDRPGPQGAVRVSQVTEADSESGAAAAAAKVKLISLRRGLVVVQAPGTRAHDALHWAIPTAVRRS